MKSQKGGNITVNTRVFTAQEILDKFSATYFNKTTIEIPTEVHQELKQFVDLAVQDKYFQWFDTSKGLILEDKYLSFDGIESRIFHHAVPISEKNMEGELIVKIPEALYSIIKNDNSVIPASHPFLQDMGKQNGQTIWRVFVKDDTNTIIDTGREVLESSYKRALVEVINKYTVLNVKAKPQFVSAFTNPGSGFPLPDANINSFASMKKSPKLVYSVNSQRKELSVYYAEKNPSNQKQIFFHPHNLVNFLMRSDIEERMKDLFSRVAKKMQSLLADCSEYKYQILPDNFYHIHVTHIPGENDILLTMHAAYEDFAEKPELKSYTLKNTHGKRYKLKGIERTFVEPTMNMPTSTPTKKMQAYRNYRRIHNAFLLLKETGSIHPFYTLSEKSQVGNPFMFPNPFFYDMQLTEVGAFGIGEAVLGTKVFNIDHITGKGVMFERVIELCNIFCDDAKESGNFKTMFTDLLEIPDATTPITPDQLLPHMQSVPGYNTSPIPDRNAPAPRVRAAPAASRLQAKIARFSAMYPTRAIDNIRRVLTENPGEDDILLGILIESLPEAGPAAPSPLNARVVLLKAAHPNISEEKIRRIIRENPDATNEYLIEVLPFLGGGGKGHTRKRNRRRVRRGTRHLKRN
jgi:hypothetical protein